MTSGLRPGCPADGFVCPDLHVVEGNGTPEAVLVSSTPSLVRTTTPGYLDLVSTVCGKVGSAVWAGACHTAIPFIVWAIANWFFPHPEGTWALKRTRKNDSFDAAQNETLKMQLMTEPAQSQTAIRTTTSPS